MCVTSSICSQCKSAFARRRSPTEISPEGKSNLPARSRYRRLLEILLAATKIDGGSVEDRQPALDGMVATLDKYCSVKSVKKYLGSGKLRKANVEAVSEEVKNFEMSKDNVTRSVSLLYAGGLLSKRKYLQTRSALSTQCIGTKTEKGLRVWHAFS